MYTPQHLQTMTDNELADAIVRAETSLQRAQDYVEYLDSCPVYRRNELMPGSLKKVQDWQRNLEAAVSVQTSRK